MTILLYLYGYLGLYKKSANKLQIELTSW